jgi:acyl-CoA thioester hydrolase
LTELTQLTELTRQTDLTQEVGRGMAPYIVDVPVRWSDQDAFGHVNHARVVTLLEEARAALLFDAAARAGLSAFEAGLLVASLDVRYRRPIPWTHQGVRVEMELAEMRAASFRVDYRLLLGDGDGAWESKPAVQAGTQLVPYDLGTARPRRLTPEEKAFLAAYEA